MRQRAISAAVLVPIVAIPYLAGNPWLTIGVAALAILAGAEAAFLVRKAGLPADPGIVVLVPMLVVLACLPPQTRPIALAYPAIIVALAATAAMRKSEMRTAFLTWVGSSFAAIWVASLVALPLIVTLPSDQLTDSFLAPPGEGGREWLLILVLTVWACDTSAYLVGRAFPRGRMLPTLSPNKTWSGGIGGAVAGAVVCALLAAQWTGKGLAIGAVIGLLVSVAAQAGDAAESLVKRAAGAKDSGKLIPGHGGVLDRIDSFLFAGPVMYLALSIMFLANP